MGKDEIFRYSYEDMLRELDGLWHRYPGKMRMEMLGWSADGRGILEVILGKKDAGRHVLIQAGMHGREYMNCAVVVRMVEEYLMLREQEKCGKGNCAWQKNCVETSLEIEGIENICFHIIPMVNPDGVMISQYGIGGIRNKKLKKWLLEWSESDGKGGRRKADWKSWKANARGVDINRNFDAGWAEYSGAEKAGAEGFKGAFPGSEAETQVVLKVAEKYAIDACISYHSSGELVYWDYGSEGALSEAEKKLAELVGAATGYRLESTRECEVDGAGCSDYFVPKLGIPAVTVETGAGTCPLKKEEFPKICSQNQGIWMALEEFCAESYTEEKNDM